MDHPTPAPEWVAREWLNCQQPPSLAALHGRVIVLEAFQMLCPACVLHALPQVLRLAQLFRQQPLAVIGLHCVFEHHEVMTAEALRAFVQEYRIGFPIGVDAPDDNGSRIPQTMHAYGMEGTPTTVLIDAAGRLRRQWLGVVDDLVLGAEIGRLLAEVSSVAPASSAAGAGECGPGGCSI